MNVVHVMTCTRATRKIHSKIAGLVTDHILANTINLFIMQSHKITAS